MFCGQFTGHMRLTHWQQISRIIASLCWGVVLPRKNPSERLIIENYRAIILLSVEFKMLAKMFSKWFILLWTCWLAMPKDTPCQPQPFTTTCISWTTSLRDWYPWLWIWSERGWHLTIPTAGRVGFWWIEISIKYLIGSNIDTLQLSSRESISVWTYAGGSLLCQAEYSLFCHRGEWPFILAFNIMVSIFQRCPFFSFL